MTLLKPLLYFSLFKYPLTEQEIFAFSELKNKKDFKVELNALVNNNIIYKIDGFYLCENNKDLVKRRLTGNKKAELILGKARKVSKFISKFPYVEGVGISGSLSKGYYDDDGDIDFFILTAPNRLWIARTLLILYKKIFLLNSKKYFCVNYFISTNALEIDEKNRFTATEVATLIPMIGNGSFAEFYNKNKWAYTILPNQNINKNSSYLKPLKKPKLTQVLEKLLNRGFGNYIDTLFMRLTYKKWKLKFKDLDRDSFNIALKSTKNVSKHHPQNFQKQVIGRLNKKYLEYQEKHNIYLSEEHA